MGIYRPHGWDVMKTLFYLLVLVNAIWWVLEQGDRGMVVLS